METGLSFSIIIPVYNAEKTVGDTVASVLDADFGDDCEIVIVDDGSTDASAEICDRLAAEDGRVKVLHLRNGGVSAARNAGMDAAEGEYLIFVDADDRLPGGCLEKYRRSIVRCAGTGGALPDLIVGGYALFNDIACGTSHGNAGDVSCRIAGQSYGGRSPKTGRWYGKDEMSLFWNENHSDNGSYLRPVWAKAFRRSLTETGESPLRFQKNLSYGEDLLFLFAFLCRCNSAVTVAEPLYFYRIGDSGLSADLSSDRHLLQLMQLCGLYAPLIAELADSLPQSDIAGELYHRDLVGRLVCRALTVFATRKTMLCTSDNISRFYALMNEDKALRAPAGLVSLRAGQIPNLLLFKLGMPRLSEAFYRFSASVCTFFHIVPKKK